MAEIVGEQDSNGHPTERLVLFEQLARLLLHAGLVAEIEGAAPLLAPDPPRLLQNAERLLHCDAADAEILTKHRFRGEALAFDHLAFQARLQQTFDGQILWYGRSHGLTLTCPKIRSNIVLLSYKQDKVVRPDGA